MEIDLSKIGMEKGQQYEIIITTIDSDGNTNAAPFGLRVLENDEIFLRIFDGGNTIRNIKDKKEFIVNVTDNPLMFTLSSINTIPDEYLTKIPKENSELAYLTDADAYFICEVKSIKSSYRENDPIKDTGINFIKAEVIELNIKNKCVKPINRAIHALIESLVKKRVGNKKEKEAIELLKDDLKKKGYEI